MGQPRPGIGPERRQRGGGNQLVAAFAHMGGVKQSEPERNLDHAQPVPKFGRRCMPLEGHPVGLGQFGKFGGGVLRPAPSASTGRPRQRGRISPEAGSGQ